ncbi:hypothetical protein [Amycolatopsis sp. NPDC021455]|uniref:hypothetical protein n=1 Tax=Amycolatopsis sp. NPDC021455 TaxID=3154901 RepID=UPI00340587E2
MTALITSILTDFFTNSPAPVIRQLAHDSRFLVFVSCLSYIAALVANHGTNVIIPHYTQLRSAVFALRGRLEALSPPEATEHLRDCLLEKADELLRRLDTRKPDVLTSLSLWIPWMTLTEVQYGWQDLHTLERQAITLESPESLPLLSEAVVVKSKALALDVPDVLANPGNEHPGDSVVRCAITEAQARSINDVSSPSPTISTGSGWRYC